MQRKKKTKKRTRLISKKTLYKTVTWRLVSIAVSFVLSLYFLGSVEQATTYTVVYNVIGSVLYYFHELAYKKLREKGKI